MPIDELPHPNQALRPERAYVLQLGEPAPNAAISGRIEHIASGAAMRFGSVDELLRFLGAPHNSAHLHRFIDADQTLPSTRL